MNRKLKPASSDGSTSTESVTVPIIKTPGTPSEPLSGSASELKDQGPPDSKGFADFAEGTPADEKRWTDRTKIPEKSAATEPRKAADNRGWDTPYVSLIVSEENGFEMGENRRFKQRVFKFKEKPADEVLKLLKESGFTYRPKDKEWTIPITPESRILTDRIVAQLIGPGQDQSRGR